MNVLEGDLERDIRSLRELQNAARKISHPGDHAKDRVPSPSTPSLSLSRGARRVPVMRIARTCSHQKSGDSNKGRGYGLDLMRSLRRPNDLSLSCTARARVPKPTRHGGCRRGVAEPRLAICNRRDAAHSSVLTSRLGRRASAGP
jgi:hypothetical protein